MGNETPLSTALGDVIAKPWSGKRPSPYQEIGASGLPHFGGTIQDEILLELQGNRWRETIRQMIDNDATISAMLFAIEMLMRQVEWTFKPADESDKAKEVEEFVKGCIFDDMEDTWPETLSEISTMLPWGWAFQEVTFKVRRGVSRDPAKSSKFDDGKIGFQRWALRAQESLYGWQFDEHGRPVVMEQLPPPDYRIRQIPLEKGLLFRTTPRKNSPEGRSILRGCYMAWYFKNRIERIEAIGLERDLEGFPVGYIPAKLFSAPAGSKEAETFASWKKIITNIKRDEQEGLLIPSDRDDKGNLLYDVQLLSTGGTRSFDTDRIIQRYDQRIAISVLADFLLIGHTQKSGSYGLASSKTEVFSTALSAWLDSICATINRHAIPRLCDLNNIPLEIAPKLTHGKVQDFDLLEFTEFVKAVSGIGIILTDADVAFIKKKAGLPVPEDGQPPKPSTMIIPPFLQHQGIGLDGKPLPGITPVPKSDKPGTASGKSEDGEKPPEPPPAPEKVKPPKDQRRGLKAASEIIPSAEEISGALVWLSERIEGMRANV